MTDLLVVFMRAEGLEMMRGKVRPLNPALWRGDAAHGKGVVSCKGYHGHAMAPCLSLLIERQGAQKRSAGLDRWKRVGSRARGETRGGAGWGWRGQTPGPGPRGRGVWCIQRGAGREHLYTAGGRQWAKIKHFQLYITSSWLANIEPWSLIWISLLHRQWEINGHCATLKLSVYPHKNAVMATVTNAYGMSGQRAGRLYLV